MAIIVLLGSISIDTKEFGANCRINEVMPLTEVMIKNKRAGTMIVLIECDV